MAQKPTQTIMRSTLGQVRGLGSAKSGTAHWWAQRTTAVALVPLSLWFVLAIYRLAGGSAANVAHWAANPVNATLLLALILVTCHHMSLGLQVVIEDYIHSDKTRLAAVLAMKGAVALLAIAAILSVLKLAVTG
jgi:succinate dehydrogenase / fumarate reductase, membrane anchor subunit